MAFALADLARVLSPLVGLRVIEPGVSKTSKPSGSRTVAIVTGPFGVG